MGSQPSIPRAMSVLVRTGNFCIEFDANRINLSSLSLSEVVVLCHNSAPYNTVGKQTFSKIEERMTGLTKFVFCSIASMEKSEDHPFWIRAFIAFELFMNVWSSIPTCVAESFWVIFASPNLTIRFFLRFLLHMAWRHSLLSDLDQIYKLSLPPLPEGCT